VVTQYTTAVYWTFTRFGTRYMVTVSLTDGERMVHGCRVLSYFVKIMFLVYVGLHWGFGW